MWQLLEEEEEENLQVWCNNGTQTPPCADVVTNRAHST